MIGRFLYWMSVLAWQDRYIPKTSFWHRKFVRVGTTIAIWVLNLYAFSLLLSFLKGDGDEKIMDTGRRIAENYHFLIAPLINTMFSLLVLFIVVATALMAMGVLGIYSLMFWAKTQGK